MPRLNEYSYPYTSRVTASTSSTVTFFSSREIRPSTSGCTTILVDVPLTRLRKKDRAGTLLTAISKRSSVAGVSCGPDGSASDSVAAGNHSLRCSCWVSTSPITASAAVGWLGWLGWLLQEATAPTNRSSKKRVNTDAPLPQRDLFILECKSLAGRIAANRR